MSKSEKNLFQGKVIWPFKRKKTTWGCFPDHFFLNPEKIAEELGAEEEGALDGSKKYPPSDAIENDRFHRKLLDAFKGYCHRIHSQRIEMLKDKERELNKFEFPELLHDMQGKVEVFSISIAEVFLHYEDDLKDSYKKLCDLEREYKLFQTMHNRKNSPKETRHFSFPLSVAVVIIIAEGGFNSFWLRDATDYGQLLGGIIAGTVSFVNIAVAMLAGWQARYINYVEPANNPQEKKRWFLKRRISFCYCLSSFLLLTLVGCINWLFSGFRTIAVKLQDIEAALPELLPEMRKDIDFWVDQSGLLFFLGLAFAAIAFYEGYSQFSDQYPEYSRIFKRKEEAKRKYKYIMKKMFDKLKEIYDQALLDMDNIILNSKGILLQFKGKSDEFVNMVSLHNSELLQTENIINSVAKKYREANIQHRGESAPPLYFFNPILFDDSYTSNNEYSTDAVDFLYQEYRSKIEYCIASKNEFIVNMFTKYNIERDRVKEELKKSEGVIYKEVNAHTEALTSFEEKQNLFS